MRWATADRVLRARELQRKQEEERRLSELAQIRIQHFQERKAIAEGGHPAARPITSVAVQPAPSPAAYPYSQPSSAAHPPPQSQPPPQPVRQPPSAPASRPLTPADVPIDIELSDEQREANAEQGARDLRLIVGNMQELLAASSESLADDDEDEDGFSATAAAAALAGPQPAGGASSGGDPMGKFRLLGATLRLPNVTERDSVAHRIESLRMFLEKMVGDDLFMQVYRLLDGMSEEDDDDAIIARANAVLGPKKIYLSLVNQLIYCEDVFYERVR
jgi:hypothetical protein